METPKIYVADLAAYNEGKLIGEWLDLSSYDSGSEVMEAIDDLLVTFGEKQGVVREEYAIHDTENIPDGLIDEYSGREDFDKLIAIIKKAEDTDIPVEVLMEYASNVGIDANELDDVPFNGRFDSEEDFAQDLVEQGVVTDLAAYLEMTTTDMRILAGEEADRQVDDMSDDEVLENVDNDFMEFERADEINEEVEQLEQELEEIKEEIDEAYDDQSEDATEEDAESIDERVSELKEKMSSIEEQISDLKSELRDIKYRDKDDAVDDAREQLKEDRYNEIYEALEKDAVGYFVDELGYDESELVNNNAFMVDYEKLARDLSQDYTFIEHDGDVYVFSSYKWGGKTYANGGGVKDIDYSEVLPIVKEKIDNAVDDINYENVSNGNGEEVEYRSMSGFTPYTNGGYEYRWFEYVNMLNGSGKSLPTKPLDDELQRQVDYNYELAKESFIERYPEIVEELGEDKINYHDLYEAGYGGEAEELSEMGMNYDGEDTVMMRVTAYYYNPENSRGKDGKHTITLFGDVNLESPYHRTGNLDDSMEITFTFNSLSDLSKKMDANLKKILNWFGGGYYKKSKREMKVRRMADGGEVKGFEAKIKDAMKQENKWHFFNEMVDGKNVQLKMFVGKKEVDVQIFRINGLGAKMPRNYVGKRETLRMIMDNFSDGFADGGVMADGGSLQDKIKHINEKYDGVTASKAYSSNRIQVVSPYFNTLNEIKRKEFNGNGLMERYGNMSSLYVLYSNEIYAGGGSVDDKYKIVDGTAYQKETPDEVIRVLENARKSGKKIKIYYGDKETGRDWLEEYDTVGTVGRSTGTYKIPLLIKTSRSTGGGGILDSSIVKIKDASSGVVLYKHPKYQQPTVEIVPSDMEGYTHNTIVNGELRGRHKSLKSAQILKSKLMAGGGSVIDGDKIYEYGITYELITPESAEMGDFEETGWEVERQNETLADILKNANYNYGIYEPTDSFSESWRSTSPDNNRDYFEKGHEKYYTLFINNVDGSDISDEERAFITEKLRSGRKLNWDDEDKEWWAGGGHVSFWSYDIKPDVIEIYPQSEEDENSFNSIEEIKKQLIEEGYKQRFFVYRSVEDMRDAVIDYYYNNDVFDDPYTYGLNMEDLNDSEKTEKAIIEYFGLDDDENVRERFEVLGLGHEEEYAGGGMAKFKSGLSSFASKSKELATKGYHKSKQLAKAGYEKTKQGVGKAKDFTKKQIHDQKKKVALEVIDETKGKVKEAKKKELLKDTKQVIKDKYKGGGKTAKKKATFKDKVKAIKARLRGTKVPKKLQGDYGKTYDAQEAQQAAQRIAGAMRAEEMGTRKKKD